jgi:excisionase family DNA binding protein
MTAASHRSPGEPRLAFGVQEVADALGVSRELVKHMIRTGQLPSVKLGISAIVGGVVAGALRRRRRRAAQTGAQTSTRIHAGLVTIPATRPVTIAPKTFSRPGISPAMAGPAAVMDLAVIWNTIMFAVHLFAVRPASPHRSSGHPARQFARVT